MSLALELHGEIVPLRGETNAASRSRGAARPTAPSSSEARTICSSESFSALSSR